MMMMGRMCRVGSCCFREWCGGGCVGDGEDGRVDFDARLFYLLLALFLLATLSKITLGPASLRLARYILI